MAARARLRNAGIARPQDTVRLSRKRNPIIEAYGDYLRVQRSAGKGTLIPISDISRKICVF